MDNKKRYFLASAGIGILAVVLLTASNIMGGQIQLNQRMLIQGIGVDAREDGVLVSVHISEPLEEGKVLLEQAGSRRKPALLQQAQELERQAGQAQALAQDRRSRALAPAFPLPSRGQASSPSQTAGETGAGQRAGGTAWPGGEEQARLVDLAFQRDSRRYDRGFSLY